MHGELKEALGVVDGMDRLAPLLDEPNRKDGIGLSKLQLALLENHEVATEFAADGSDRFSPEETAGELADVFVFLTAWLQANPRFLDMDMTKGASNINGAGSRSDALEVLDVLLQESADDFKAAREAIFLIISLHGHLGVANTFLETILHTKDKVVRNRPPIFYQTVEQGKLLTAAERAQKYRFLEQAFRIIRKAVKNTTGRHALVSADWLPHIDLISAWREGDSKLIELRAKLAVELGEDQQTPVGVFVPNPAQTYLYGGRRSQHIQ